MSCVLTIPMNPLELSLYEECKIQCNFSHKTHSDFLVFLLNSAVHVVSLVKEFSPILKDVPTLHLPENVDNVLKMPELPQEENKQDTGCEPPDMTERINSPVSEEILEHSCSDSLATPSAVEELLVLLNDNTSESVQELNLINNVKMNQFKPDISEKMERELAQTDSEADEMRLQQAITTSTSYHHDKDQDGKNDELLCDKLLAEHFKNYSAEIYPEKNLQFDIELCEKGPWICSECMNHYQSRSTFRRHICGKQDKSLLSNMIIDQYAMRQPDNGRVDQLDENPNHGIIHSCRVCRRRYSCKTDLMMHLRSSDCITMNNENAKVNKLRREPLATSKYIKHVKPVVNFKNFKCPKCNAGLASKRSVRLHLRNKQCRKRCHICGFAAYRENLLIKHMRTYHSLPNSCQAEGNQISEEILPQDGYAKSKDSQVMDIPLRVIDIKRSQQKLYNCPHCEFCTNSAGGFGSHINNKKHSL